MSDSHRARLLLEILLFVGVMATGWICGSSPVVTSFAAGFVEQLLNPPAPVAAPHMVVTGTLPAAFDPAVRRWEPEILTWSATYQLDPNLVATIMQIESCGDPDAVSTSGAQGLFQVMPFHFAAGDDMTDPQTNATRGLAYFADSLQRANGDVLLALAAYNGGQELINVSSAYWPAETHDYTTWGVGVYTDVSNGLNPSPTLERWLAAGGASLCRQAAEH